MIRTLLLLALWATSAEAQPAPPTAGQRVLLVTGAVAGGLVTAGLVGPFVPITVAAATYGTSAALGLRPTVGGVLLDTAIGTAVGVGVGVATYAYVTEVQGADADLSASLGSALTGLVAGAAVTGAVHGVRLAALRAPTGGQAVGLRVIVGL